jgi:TRAP-type uncharacterized transport system fused permease subunit
MFSGSAPLMTVTGSVTIPYEGTGFKPTFAAAASNRQGGTIMLPVMAAGNIAETLGANYVVIKAAFLPATIICLVILESIYAKRYNLPTIPPEEIPS